MKITRKEYEEKLIKLNKFRASIEMVYAKQEKQRHENNATRQRLEDEERLMNKIMEGLTFKEHDLHREVMSALQFPFIEEGEHK